MNLPISSMSIAEKLAAMEALWTSLQNAADGVSPPAWHAQVLAERQARMDRGETLFSTLDEVRERLEAGGQLLHRASTAVDIPVRTGPKNSHA